MTNNTQLTGTKIFMIKLVDLVTIMTQQIKDDSISSSTSLGEDIAKIVTPSLLREGCTSYIVTVSEDDNKILTNDLDMAMLTVLLVPALRKMDKILHVSTGGKA